MVYTILQTLAVLRLPNDFGTNWVANSKLFNPLYPKKGHKYQIFVGCCKTLVDVEHFTTLLAMLTSSSHTTCNFFLRKVFHGYLPGYFQG